MDVSSLPPAFTSSSGLDSVCNRNRQEFINSDPLSNTMNGTVEEPNELEQLALATHHMSQVWHEEMFSQTKTNQAGPGQHRHAWRSSAGAESHNHRTSASNSTTVNKFNNQNWVVFEDDATEASTGVSMSAVPGSHSVQAGQQPGLATENSHTYSFSVNPWVSIAPVRPSSGQHSTVGLNTPGHFQVGSSMFAEIFTDQRLATVRQFNNRTPDKQTTQDYSEETDVLTTDGLRHFDHVINSTTKNKYGQPNSAPVLIQRNPSGGRQARCKSAYPGSYADSQRTTMFVNSAAKDAYATQVQQFKWTSVRPHSVDIPVPDTAHVFHTATDDRAKSTTPAQDRRTQFTVSHKTSRPASLPQSPSMTHTVKHCTQPVTSTATIFRTSSSVSIHSDSSTHTDAPTQQHPLNTNHTALSNTPRSYRWKKASKWVSLLLGRKVMSGHALLDDSMDFGFQPSLTSDRQTINVDKMEVPRPHSNDVDNKMKDKNKQPTLESQSLVDNDDPGADSKQESRTAVYKKRWYLLFLFSVSAMLWNAVWSTWGPIAQSAKDVFDWADSDIAMFIWLGNIPFLLTMFPCCYLMDVKGMRIAMIVASIFMFLGTGFRCIPSDVTTATWLIRIGQFLNGMAGTIPNSAPALLSGLWFPPNQRASATAISTVAGYMGASVSFVIGPLLVPQPNDLLPINNTDDTISVNVFLDTDNNTNTTSYDAQMNGIMNILYAECAVAGLLLLLVLIYFPSKPPLPPSVSASMPREKYIPGIKMLVRNKQFWVCALAFSVPAGVYEAWQVILDVILDDRGVSQQTAGWLDFYATIGGCVSGLLVSRFADFFTRQMKLFLLIFYFFASVSILWFTLVVFGILPFDRVSMYAAIVIAGVFLDGGGPLFFELTIEVSYPVGEGVTSGFTQMLCAAAGILFLSVVQVQSLGKQWINWYFFGCVAMAIPLLFFITTTYGRADIDDMEIEVESDDNPPPGCDEKTYLFGSSHV